MGGRGGRPRKRAGDLSLETWRERDDRYPPASARALQRCSLMRSSLSSASLSPAQALRLIKTVHTAVWALMAGAILALPALAWLELWRVTAGAFVLVLGECLVLAANGMRCPLTDLATRYTDERTDNFDIYLPAWLARHNQRIFGSLFALGLLFTLSRLFS
jgi:hypothetical protein